MSSMPERLTAWWENLDESKPRWVSGDWHGGTEYVRRDLVAEKDAEIERLRKVADQATKRHYRLPTDIERSAGMGLQDPGCVAWDRDGFTGWEIMPELATYLKEKQS